MSEPLQTPWTTEQRNSTEWVGDALLLVGPAPHSCSGPQLDWWSTAGAAAVERGITREDEAFTAESSNPPQLTAQAAAAVVVRVDYLSWDQC